MTLVPIKKLYNQDEDPYFNEPYAKHVYDLVSKMDDDEAEMYAYLVANAVLEEDITKNLRTLQRRVDQVVAKRLVRIRKAALAAGKGEELDKFVEITKATSYDYGYRFQASEHPREGRTGRFTTKVRINPKQKPIEAKDTVLGMPKDSTKGLKPQAKSQLQQEYAQLSNFLQAYQGSTPDAGFGEVLMTVRNKTTGATYQVPTKGTKPVIAWDPATERLETIEVRGGHLTAGGMGFNLATALGGSQDTAWHAGQMTNAADRNFERFSDDWTAQADDDFKNTNQRLYRRTQTAGQMAQVLGANHPAVQTAGRLAELVGQHGPEAEKVVGPHLRKTAYRYRGTEKTPDKTLVREYAAAISRAKDRARNAPARGLHQWTQDKSEDAQRPPTWAERAAGRAAIIGYLGGEEFGGARGDQGKIPSKKLYGLNLAAGNTPPSQGVMLNADGQIVAEAVGYGDDHYLPFNLKNLKGLKGGEYIRTRSVGGPTSEDIYTGLMAGARQVTVISRSGSFTVTFDDTFRGGRRYNDKALRMTDRYEHLLDAVQSEQVDSNPVDPEVQMMIRREVDRDYADYPRAEQKRIYDSKIEEYKTWDGLDEHDNAIIDFQVSRDYPEDPQGKSAQKMRRALVSQAMAAKEYKYRLNGEGYSSALKSLEEQFPYYITVASQPRREEHMTEQEKDKGYVMPRHNRPTAALHGYFEARVAGQGKEMQGRMTGKISASEADFQNTRHRSAASRGVEETTDRVASGTMTPVETPESKRRAVSEAIQDRTDQDEVAGAAYAVISAAGAKMDESYLARYPVARLVKDGTKRAEFDALMKTPAGREQVRQMINDPAPASQAAYRASGEAWARYQNLDRNVDLKNYSAASSGEFQDKPFSGFAGDAFKKSAPPKMISDKIEELGRTSMPLTADKKYGDMTDAELREEHKALMRIHSLHEFGLQGEALKENIERLGAGITNTHNAVLLAKPDEKNWQAQVDKLHKVRLLKWNLDRALKKDQAKSGAKVDQALKGIGEPPANGPTRPSIHHTGTAVLPNNKTEEELRKIVDGKINELTLDADAESNPERKNLLSFHANEGKKAKDVDAMNAWLDILNTEIYNKKHPDT
jgi:hypothetical protein